MTVRRLLGAALLFATAGAQAAEVRLAREPAPSPDGRRVAFSWHGDLFVGPAEGGAARRLTVHPGEDRAPSWSPDGRRLVFASNRFDNWDVFTIGADGDGRRRITHHSDSDTAPVFTPDGESVVFASRRGAAFWQEAGLWIAAADGSRDPEPFTAYGASRPALSGAGELAFVRGRSSWYRKNYRGSADADVWLETADGELRSLTAHDGHDDFPTWCRIGGREQLCYRSDRSGTFNAWSVDPTTGRRTRLTDFDDGILLSSLKHGGGLLAFERLDRLAVHDLRTGRTRELRFEAPEDSRARERRTLTLTDRASDLAFSSDGEQMAFVLRGDVFAARAEDDVKDKTAARVTDSPGRDRQPAWLPDRDGLVFASDRHGHYDLFLARPREGAPTSGEGLARALAFDVERLTRTADDDLEPVLSPDGTTVAFQRSRGDLVLLHLESREETLLSPGWNLSSVSFSPDGRWLAFARSDEEFNSEVFLVPADGSAEPVNVSRHPDSDDSPRWSANGRALAFRAERQGQDPQAALLMLRASDGELDPEALERAWERAARTASKSGDGKEKEAEAEQGDAEVLVDFDRIHERVRLLSPMPAGSQLAIAPDGLTAAFSARGLDGKTDLWSIRWDGTKKERLTEGGEDPSSLAWSADGKSLTWLSGGRARRVAAKGGSPDTLPFRARFVVDVAAERRQVFHEAWRSLGRDYYDPAMHGADWEALRSVYAPLAETAVTRPEFVDVVDRMLGELNSSHLGFRGGGDEPELESETTGELGLELAPPDEGPGRLVLRVVADGPCDTEAAAVQPGERLVAVDDTPLEPAVRLHELLAQRAGERVRLTFEGEERRLRGRDGGSRVLGGERREVVVEPVDPRRLRRLMYEEWIRERRRLADEITDGRIGYLHVRSMNTPSLERFEQELYSVGHGRDALVIDVRNNGGGWTADYMLAILMVQPHATTVPRGGGPGYPQGRRPLYAWTKPVATLCNAGSFSNAEIFSHAMKTLGRGPVVGETTGGGVISTGGTRLLDGTWLRLPFRGWWSNGTGLDMEGNGAVPDHPIEQRPEDEAAGRDPQLEKALRLLLWDLQTANQLGD